MDLEEVSHEVEYLLRQNSMLHTVAKSNFVKIIISMILHTATKMHIDAKIKLLLIMLQK